MYGTKNFSHATRCVALALAMLASMAACPSAHAAQGAFMVSVHVVRGDAQRIAPTDIPVPPGAQPMMRAAAFDSFVFAGAPEEAARFYRDEMPRRGYRLLHGSAEGTTWESARYRLRVRLDPVLGTQPATRIVVVADSMS